MDFWDGLKDFGRGVIELGKAFATGEAQRDLAEIARWAGRSFLTDVLEIDIDKKIDRNVAANELAAQIKNNIARGNYSTVNVGLTAEVSGIQRRSNKTKVDFSVSCDDSDETCHVKLNSRHGTDLRVGDRLKLTLR